MILIDQSGRIHGSCGCGDASLFVGGFPMPIIVDPTTGAIKSMILRKVNNVTHVEIIEPTPRIQDDDDRQWRSVYVEEVFGQYAFRFGDPDDVPGYPLLAYNSDSGKIERGYTNQINGTTHLRWAPIS